ncbi:MAG: Transcriptional regulator, LysR family, partial [uncultured Rubrobacteraceae bacterium]
MELRHIRCFVAVAEEMHFGRAAERLYVAQSAVSQQVKRLEQELGVELLTRNKRRVSLTEPGRVFLDEARRTLWQAEKGAEAAKRASRGQVGRIVVGFIGPTTYSIVPEVLGAYRKRFADVEMVLHEWT